MEIITAGDADVNVIDVNAFDPEWLKKIPIQKRKRGNQGTKVRKRYKDIVTSFDIETTSLPEIRQSFMYVWQWAFGTEFVVMGRTWDEFNALVRNIKVHLGTDEYIVVYVHNLSYEFQFLSGIYDFCEAEVFAIGSRKVLKADMENCLEFRCSYIHSNMSLKKWTEKLGVEHGKLSGDDFDYAKIRDASTPLSDYEIQYCLNDVLGVVEAIEYECSMDDDNLYSIPLTSTGYVRRDVKDALKVVNHYWMGAIQPSWHVYEMLREAFRGGNTHANRYYAGKIMKDVHSADRASAYPAELFLRQFPVRPFHEYGPATMEEVVRMVTVRHKAVIMRVKIWGLRLHDDGWGCPYLSYDKVRHPINAALDNGRILEADYLETTLTDIDFRILLEEYDFDSLEPYDVAHSTYGPLPDAYREQIKKYYDAKTLLKGDEENAYYYNKSKEKLNSLYGLSAQDPVRITEIYDHGEWSWKDEDPEEILESSNKKCFLPYQWGVWCTAWGRWDLEQGIKACGDNFIYTDTDSIKYVGKLDLDKLNAAGMKLAIEQSGYSDDKHGKRHFMGVFEYEGKYERFVTLGAKKYAYDEDGKLHITIAGVNKKLGALEMEKHGGLEAFKVGFVFREGGGNEVVYNDAYPTDPVKVNGHDVQITKNVWIGPSEYTLGVTDEYQKLIDNPKILHRIGIDNFIKKHYNVE